MSRITTSTYLWTKFLHPNTTSSIAASPNSNPTSLTIVFNTDRPPSPPRTSLRLLLASIFLVTGEEGGELMIMGLLPIRARATRASLPTTLPTSSSTSSSSLGPRPAVILPGLGNNSKDYQGLVSTLQQTYQVPSVVAKVSRLDWLRNAAGLADANYWKGTLRPRPVLDWYLGRVEEAISVAKKLTQGQGVSLIGHSAGGWLARVFMEEFGTSHVSLLLTLGSPHLPPPKGLPGVVDQTRGLLDYVEKCCAPARYSPELKYVCVAGRYIQGARLVGKPESISTPNDLTSADLNMAESAATSIVVNPDSRGPTFQARFVGQGYKQVCGRADVWGDGVVPEVSAHLEGALNISLDGVYHSPVGSDDTQRPWYGSPAAVEKWAHHLLN